jgi:hypothetical protein
MNSINNIDNANNTQADLKICFDTNVKNAINYVIHLFRDKKKESVKLIGLSLAISKVILIAEVVKTHIKKLHQVTNIDCLITKDKFNPEKIKRVPKLEILLTVNEPNIKGDGYQRPMTDNELSDLTKIKLDDLDNLDLDLDDNIDVDVEINENTDSNNNNIYKEMYFIK